MKVLVVPAGGSANIKMAYTPEFIAFDNNKTTKTIGRVTATREGTGTLVNLDNDGVRALGQTLQYSAIGKDTLNIIPVANGYVNGGFYLECTNTGVADINVYAWSTQKGTCFVTSIIDTAVQNTSTRYEKFLRLVANPTNTDPSDIITHFYRKDESKQAVLVTYPEVYAITGTLYNNREDTGSLFQFITWDNTDLEFSAIVIQPVNAVTMYLQRLVN